MSDYRFVIVGLGNVAWHLERMLLLAGIKPILVHSAWNESHFSRDVFEPMDESNCIVFLTVRDVGIASVANRFQNAFLVHCSGSIPLRVLPENRSAVLWPVQTFTRGVDMDYAGIPFILESGCDDLGGELSKIFSCISGKVILMDSESRMKVHLAAVIAQNFSNRLIAEADNILSGSGMDYTELLPLLSESLRKLYTVHPLEAQTGPAVRGDFEVLNSHLKRCAEDPGLKDLYQLISSRINPNFSHE
jgi:predicted short-subunit dehydrogenase-like oxidoreductase (DUF2520 family)